MSDPHTTLTLAVEVQGTTDEVWAAVATGQGMSSWYVPSTVDERPGGATTSRFGDGDEMLIPGRVVVWDPPRRVCFDGGADAVGGMTFDWTVEPTDRGTHVVRLAQAGFEPTPDGRAAMAAMHDGWQLFLQNLRLHLEHFRGQQGTAALPMGGGPGPRTEVWALATAALGIPAAPTAGDHVRAATTDAPPLGGTVMHSAPWRMNLLLDEPLPGTGWIAVEGDDDHVVISVWLYLYGPDATATAATDGPRWAEWLAAIASR